MPATTPWCASPVRARRLLPAPRRSCWYNDVATLYGKRCGASMPATTPWCASLVRARQFASCATTVMLVCDDGDPAENDMQGVDACDNAVVCIPCAGTPVASCATTVMLVCDDGDPVRKTICRASMPATTPWCASRVRASRLLPALLRSCWYVTTATPAPKTICRAWTPATTPWCASRVRARQLLRVLLRSCWYSDDGDPARRTTCRALTPATTPWCASLCGHAGCFVCYYGHAGM